jgi:hypothetical protein
MKRTSGLHVTLRVFYPADKASQEAVNDAYGKLDGLREHIKLTKGLILEEKPLFSSREIAEEMEPEGEDNSDLLEEGEANV